MILTFKFTYETLTDCDTEDYETNRGFIITGNSIYEMFDKCMNYFENNTKYTGVKKLEVKQISEHQIECYLNRNYKDLREEI